jgi:hypothetical protein
MLELRFSHFWQTEKKTKYFNKHVKGTLFQATVDPHLMHYHKQKACRLINVMRKQFKNKSIASHLLGLLRDDEI